MESKTERASRVQAEWRAKNPDKHKATQTSIRHRTKLEVIEMYGGKCVCCGTTVIDFLTIDHVHGGGRAERRDQSSTKTLWKLAREAFGTDKYQLLCMNCNHSKHVNGGTCCHQGGTRPETTSKTTRYDRKLRLDVLAALGGVCTCCGESEPGFLTVDHVNDDGHEHRTEKGATGSLRDIRAGGYDRTRYQVLCFNCNLNKAISGGTVCLCKTGRPVLPVPIRKLTTALFLSPDGKIVEVVNIKRFCDEHRLSNGSMHEMISGRRKTCGGWRLAPETLPGSTG